MQEPQTQGQGAPAGGQALSDEDRKLEKMSKVMVGSGAAIAFSAFLPWTSGLLDNFSPIEVWQGWLLLICGGALAAYGYQGLSPKYPYVQYHGWAIAALSVGGLLIILMGGEINELAEAGGFEPGIGLLPAVVGAGLAIWALVVLRKDGIRREREVMRPGAPAPAVPAPAVRASAQSGWYPDPMARHEQRYFDGSAWTEHVVDGGRQVTDPVN